MATRTSTCPTCNAQTTILVCDNCHNDIPADTAPAMSGRVWDADKQAYLPVVLCTTCADLSISIRAVATANTSGS